jgi:hypothetical protein
LHTDVHFGYGSSKRFRSCKTSIDVEGDRLSAALIKQVVYTNVTMMDEYLPGILSVIYGNVSPAEAIAQIEGELE